MFGSGVGHENHGGAVTSSSAFISHLLRHSFAESKLNKYFPVYKALQAQYEVATLCLKEEMNKLKRACPACSPRAMGSGVQTST